ncbi:hypothetical protein [Catellatospora tritici]|uniref:hypothetical protein n=1 Tax=Catellatospora tritici TaxID=2851566 RepID=UPI001C2CD8D1|nr:hypothetical protein [Catellatospora tritici]MBV1854620.1 hypothetical protein [Catellatospora tritici]
MDSQALATVFAGIGLFLLAGSTWLQYRENRKSRRLTEYSINVDLSDRVWHQVPTLATVLELPEDGIPERERAVIVGFLLTYAQAWKAARLGLYPDSDWDGLRTEFAFWAAQPKAERAIDEFRRAGEGWPPGFLAFVVEEVAAYRRRKATRPHAAPPRPVPEAEQPDPGSAS